MGRSIDIFTNNRRTLYFPCWDPLDFTRINRRKALRNTGFPRGKGRHSNEYGNRRDYHRLNEGIPVVRYKPNEGGECARETS